MERAYVPDSSLSLILRNKTHINAKPLPNKQTQQAFLKRSKNLQKLAVRLCSRVKPPLPLMAGDFAVVPRHFLVGCSCDQLLELRSLTDDGLLHGFALNRKNDHVLSPCFAIMTFYLKLRGGLHRSLLVFLNLLTLGVKCGGRWCMWSSERERYDTRAAGEFCIDVELVWLFSCITGVKKILIVVCGRLLEEAQVKMLFLALVLLTNSFSAVISDPRTPTWPAFSFQLPAHFVPIPPSWLFTLASTVCLILLVLVSKNCSLLVQLLSPGHRNLQRNWELLPVFLLEERFGEIVCGQSFSHSTKKVSSEMSVKPDSNIRLAGKTFPRVRVRSGPQNENVAEKKVTTSNFSLYLQRAIKKGGIVRVRGLGRHKFFKSCLKSTSKVWPGAATPLIFNFEHFVSL